MRLNVMALRFADRCRLVASGDRIPLRVANRRQRAGDVLTYRRSSAPMHLLPGRVEEGRGGGRLPVAVGGPFGALPQAHPGSVSPPRSSNRTCGFPASGFPTGFIARHTAAVPSVRA